MNKNQFAQNILRAQFLVDQNQTICYLPIWEAQDEWFKNLPNSIQAYTCSGCPNGGAGAIIIDPNDRICNVANDLIPFTNNSITYSSDQDERRWTDRYQVYSLLINDNCSNLPNQLLQFQSQMNNSEIGKLANIDILLNGLAQDINNNATLDGLNTTVDAKLAQLSVLRSQEDYKITNANVQQVISELNSTYASINTIMDGIMTDLASDLSSILQDNSNIVTNTTIASRLKFVNDIQVRLMLDPNIILTSAEELELNNIANLCPSQGSFATLKARGILHALGNTDIFNDSGCYIPILPLSRKLEIATFVNVVPNPSSDYCYISLSNYKSIKKIKLYDQLSRLLMEIKHIDQKIYQLDTQELMNGIYKIEIEDNISGRYSSKISIIK